MGPRTDSLPRRGERPLCDRGLSSLCFSPCAPCRALPHPGPLLRDQVPEPAVGRTGLSGPSLLASFLPVALELAGFRPLEIWGVTCCWSRCSQTPAPAPLLPWEAAPHFPFWAASSRTET